MGELDGEDIVHASESMGVSTFDTKVGIRQGAIESPCFFGILIEWALEEIAAEHQWSTAISSYPDLPVTQAAFMDDLLIWDGNTTETQQRLNHLIKGFARWGLSINLDKCSLYVSPKHSGPNFVKVGDKMLTPQQQLVVMGVPFKVGFNVQDMLQPTWAKARDKFWAAKHLLKAPTPIGWRLQMMDKVIGNSALWCISAFPPEQAALQAINVLQCQFVLWLGLRKAPAEEWVDFRKRGMRQARQLIHKHLHERWSSKWLSRWWGYCGHIARCRWGSSPTCSSLVCYFRPLEWWETEQKRPNGLRHSGRYYTKIYQTDKLMNVAALGPWRDVAQDRARWKMRAVAWILQNDVPWASGLQFSIEW